MVSTVVVLSDILEEESNGYVELGLGRETLAQRQKIERVIEAENNNYMRAWLPLDFAQAYMTMGEAEESIKELRDFYGRI